MTPADRAPPPPHSTLSALTWLFSPLWARWRAPFRREGFQEPGFGTVNSTGPFRRVLFKVLGLLLSHHAHNVFTRRWRRWIAARRCTEVSSAAVNTCPAAIMSRWWGYKIPRLPRLIMMELKERSSSFARFWFSFLQIKPQHKKRDDTKTKL